jgi:phosphate ABC transporter phosphate-binding protein
MAGLARFAIRFRYAIIAFWLVAGALCIALFPSLGSAVNTDNSSFLPSSSPSVHAMNLAAPFQPTSDTTGTLVVLGKSKLSSSDLQSITKLQNKEVIFAASDMPLNLVDLDMDGFVQFPTLTAGVVPVVNIDGVKPGELVLDGATLARIFLGEIKAWNDPAIRKLNPSLKLPSRPIAVVYRADGSGTTFVFTDYLNKVSPKWKTTVGSTTAVEWPVGTGVKGNDGVAASVGGLKGAIGYVEYAYAKQNKLTYVKLMNKAGKAVAPSIESFSAAAANAGLGGSARFRRHSHQ